MAQFSGLARKKGTTQAHPENQILPVLEELEDYVDSDDAMEGAGRDLLDGSDSYGANKPFWRAPYPDRENSRDTLG